MDNLVQVTTLQTASFLSSFYKLIGAQVISNGQKLKVSLDDETAKELDGPWAKGYSLDFVFREEDLNDHPEAELVTMGSYRIHHLIQQAMTKGRFTRTAISPSAIKRNPVNSQSYRDYELKKGLCYLPYLIITFSCAYVGASRWEELITLALNRITGEIIRFQWSTFLPHIQKCDQRVQKQLLKARIGLYRAYHSLEQAAINTIASQDPTWSHEARAKLEKEEQDLHSYFRKLSQESIWQDPEAQGKIEKMKELRLKEQEERFAPRVYIRSLQAALVAVPEVTSTCLRIQASKEETVVIKETPFGQIRPAVARE